MQLLAQRRQQVAHPGLECQEPGIGIIGFAGLMIGAADNQDVGLARCRLQTNVVVGFKRVPVESIRQGLLRYRERHGIGAVG